MSFIGCCGNSRTCYCLFLQSLNPLWWMNPAQHIDKQNSRSRQWHCHRFGDLKFRILSLNYGLDWKRSLKCSNFFEFCKLWVMSNHSQIWFHFHTGHILILILGKLILRRTVHKGFPCFSPVLRVRFVGCSNYLWLTQAFCLAHSSVLREGIKKNDFF